MRQRPQIVRGSLLYAASCSVDMRMVVNMYTTGGKLFIPCLLTSKIISVIIKIKDIYPRNTEGKYTFYGGTYWTAMGSRTKYCGMDNGRSGDVMGFAAHIREKDGQFQTVAEHCENVSEIARRYGERIGISTICEIAGLLHDIGKLIRKFNEYIHGENTCRRGEIDHSFAGARYIRELTADDKKLRPVGRFIGRVILSHHGLKDWVDDEGTDNYSRLTEKSENYEEILDNLKLFPELEITEKMLEKAADEYAKVRQTLVEITMNISEKRRNKAFAFYMGMFERLAESILIDADRVDTANFMSDEKTEREYDLKAILDLMERRMDDRLAGFDGLTDSISERRKDISERCKKAAQDRIGITKLIVPTGGGKTLSSLRFAIQYCKKHGKERIIYTAPFLSILEQNADEFRKIAGEENFLEHHSNYAAEIADDIPELHEYELRSEKWDTPVIATTMVQLLNALFSGKTTDIRRMHRLANSVIIIDEVQSLPIKCVYLFNLAMNFLSAACDATVVLCTATQPPFDKLDKFPIMLDENTPNITGNTEEDFKIFKRVKIEDLFRSEGYKIEEIADFCAQKQKEFGNLLLIVNTKSEARELFGLLKERSDAETIHLSTSMCPQHRREIISRLRENNSGLICVTTQLIEAGVDVSFGCVVRLIAGMDNAAQAAGRCNRNGECAEVRPVYLLNIRDEKLNGLPEIATAKDISIAMLQSDSYSDLLGVEAMEAYFAEFYDSNSKKLFYNTENPSGNLLDFLSENKDWFGLSGKRSIRNCAQAFKTAGSLFEVIADGTVGIIVPYSDSAKELIAKLNSDISPAEQVKLLRGAQKFTVNVYPDLFKTLCENGGVYELACGAFALEERYYSAEFGITKEPLEREFLEI